MLLNDSEYLAVIALCQPINFSCQSACCVLPANRNDALACIHSDESDRLTSSLKQAIAGRFRGCGFQSVRNPGALRPDAGDGCPMHGRRATPRCRQPRRPWSSDTQPPTANSQTPTAHAWILRLPSCSGSTTVRPGPRADFIGALNEWPTSKFAPVARSLVWDACGVERRFVFEQCVRFR